MYSTLERVGQKFRLPGKLYSYEFISNGNINTTIKATYLNDDKSVKPYLFQRINTYVFKNPIQIMSNIDNVTSYLRENYPDETLLHFHHTAQRDNYYFDEDGSFWRVINFIDSITYNTCDDPAVIVSTGEAFGKFQSMLCDFDASKLYYTIPDFHNTPKRMADFFAHVKEDPFKRVAQVAEEIEYISSVREKAEELYRRFERGELPLRVTHNDTKCNNVLFDKKTKKPLVVIDLDTVMPGISAVDFGDAVRFIANTAAEDEPDTGKVFFDTAKYRAFCRGYIPQVIGKFSNAEIASLPLSAFAITVELAVRFLDDFITGDKYFKIRYPAHNLVRARCQIKLSQDILRKLDELSYIVTNEVEKATNAGK